MPTWLDPFSIMKSIGTEVMSGSVCDRSDMGGQPIGALEWFFDRIAKRVRGMMPKRRAEPREAEA